MHTEQDKKRCREHHHRLKLLVFEAYGGAYCKHCGNNDVRVLQLDHINGGGTKERRDATNKDVYRRLVKANFPPGFQVLCANCNWIKRWENKEGVA